MSKRCESYRAQFLKIFKSLCYTRDAWSVWYDIISAIACSIANVFESNQKRREKREKEYTSAIEKLGNVEKTAELLGIIVNALEEDPEQDFLGAIYMELELGNKYSGQFFTPYSVSKMCAEMNLCNSPKGVKENGWITICDPCVGGGAMLIAAANTLKDYKINYSNHVLFIGQDIDRVVGMMAYIQISLLACPGYIAIGDSLSNPIVGEHLVPVEGEGQEFWFTPFYYTDVWKYRILFSSINSLFKDSQEIRPARGGFLFELKKGDGEHVF